jgi:RNA polymerase sigma-70 factor (ECF subfamily)
MDTTRVAAALEQTELSDEQLAAEAAREGSEGPAFSALFERYEERVWRICYRLVGNAEDATDAAQEVFVRLFFERGKFAGRSRYSTWVHGIALRVCLSFRRGRGRRQKHEQAAQERNVRDERHIEPEYNVGDSLDLAAMLETLDEEERAMLILKYAEGYNHNELAEMFGVSVSACKMRIHRAVQKLKERFPDQSFGEADSQEE